MASTPVGSNAVIMEVLDRNNYKHWRSRLETYLLAEDLWKVIEANGKPPKAEDDPAGDETWSRKNAKALYAIQNSCGRELFSLIDEIKTAKGAWEALEQELKVLRGYDDNNVDHREGFELFIRYVKRGDWDEAKKCLGDVDIRSVLMKRSVPLSWWRRTGTTLHLATQQGHVHIVKELVQLMTQDDLKTQTNDGHTALHLAAEKGHVHVLKELPVALMGEVKDEYGRTALHIAVREGKTDAVKELVMLMRKEDLKIKNNFDYTALHLAVKKGNMPMVKELVKMMREEDLKIKNDAGYTTLHLAVNKGDMPMVKEFVRKQQGENNIGQEEDFKRYKHFIQHVIYGDWDEANECLRELDDPCGAITAVNPKENHGDTALHIAARGDHLAVIEGFVLLLKKRDEDLELRTEEDFTTFGAGIIFQVSEEVLMEKAKYMVDQWEKTLGRSLEVPNGEGCTALHVAITMGNVEIVKKLAHLMKQEKLEMKDGDLALHSASYRGNLEIVKELVPLMRPEGLEIKDEDGDTALTIALRERCVDIAKELVKSMRSDGLEIKNNKGSNALHLAVTEEYVEIVTQIIPRMRPGALGDKDGQGYTALGWAIQCLKDGDVCRLVEIMAERTNNQVFGIPSAPNNDIPALHALRWNKWKSARIIRSLTPPSVFTGPNGLAFICYCLNARIQIDLACDMLQDYTFSTTVEDEVDLMLMLSRMNFAPLSGRQLTPWKRWIYDRIHVDTLEQCDMDTLDSASIKIDSPIEDDHDIKGDYFSSVLNLSKGCLNGLQKLCGIHDLYEMKASYTGICEVIRNLLKDIHKFQPECLDDLKKSIFSAIQQGNSEFVTHVLKGNPDLFSQLNRQVGKGIFHLAVENRQKEVFNLIYGLKEKERLAIGLHVVNEDNNLLHYAANLSSIPQFGHILDASLQMQRELQWFKEVERVVPGEMYEHRNRSNNMTARELFTENHKKLMEDAETSIKGTATSCTVVGALIVTIMFAAAFTFPGGNDSNTGFPLLIGRKLFNLFILADTISLVSSTSSVITFLGMLTSRYAEDDFLKSLPTKMMIGLMTLFFSIVNMMIAFSCALIIMFEEKTWMITVSILLTSVPIILFLWLLFPLLIKTFMSTFGREIFDGRNSQIVI